MVERPGFRLALVQNQRRTWTDLGEKEQFWAVLRVVVRYVNRASPSGLFLWPRRLFSSPEESWRLLWFFAVLFYFSSPMVNLDQVNNGGRKLPAWAMAGHDASRSGGSPPVLNLAAIHGNRSGGSPSDGLEDMGCVGLGLETLGCGLMDALQVLDFMVWDPGLLLAQVDDNFRSLHYELDIRKRRRAGMFFKIRKWDFEKESAPGYYFKIISC